MKPTSTLLSIQYLRALAACAVVAFHTNWSGTDAGQAGVDVFFVISGFIMVLVSSRETTPLAFLHARILRVVPLYWLVTLAVAIRDQPNARNLLLSLAFIPHAGPGNPDGFPVIFQGWTLSYEVLFYTVFAVSLLIPARIRLPGLTLVLLTLTALGAAVLPTWPTAQAYPLMLEFVAGAWLCRVWQRGYKLSGPFAWAVLVGGFALFALPPANSWLRLAVWGSGALLVVGGALGIEAAGQLPRVPGLKMLGDASYALYLTHNLVFDPIREWLRILPAPVAVLTGITVCSAAAVLVHYGVERPLQRWCRSHLGSFRLRRAEIG